VNQYITIYQTLDALEPSALQLNFRGHFSVKDSSEQFKSILEKMTDMKNYPVDDFIETLLSVPKIKEIFYERFEGYK